MAKRSITYQVREKGEAWGLPILSTYAESEEFIAEGIQFRRAVRGLPPVEIKFRNAKKPTFDVYFSEVDGVCVVHVQTDDLPENEGGPEIRIYINDYIVYENPVYPGLPASTVVE